jgi:hypothetical protein
MSDTPTKTAQIHIRVTPNVKRAVKVHCAQMGTTEQAWVERMIETALHKRAPELLPPWQRRASGRPSRRSK